MKIKEDGRKQVTTGKPDAFTDDALLSVQIIGLVGQLGQMRLALTLQH
jgi:hypothetical protein